jgi:hypothetical protein
VVLTLIVRAKLAALADRESRPRAPDWRRDVTLGEDACWVMISHAPLVLAALNNAVLALVDFLDLPKLPPPRGFLMPTLIKRLTSFFPFWLLKRFAYLYSTFAQP